MYSLIREPKAMPMLRPPTRTGGLPLAFMGRSMASGLTLFPIACVDTRATGLA